MLRYASPRKCEKCGKVYKRLVEQDMPRYCINCGKEVYYCDECEKYGCPTCGGKLGNIWDKLEGRNLMI